MSKKKKAAMQAKEASAGQPAAEAKAPSDDGRAKKISAAAHAAGGAVAGMISYFIGADYALPTGIILLFVLWTVIQKATGTGKKSIGWWAANGLFLYLFIWLDAWVFIFNFI